MDPYMNVKKVLKHAFYYVRFNMTKENIGSKSVRVVYTIPFM